MSYIELTIDAEDVCSQLNVGEVVRYFDTEDIFMEMRTEQIAAGLSFCADTIKHKSLFDYIFEHNYSLASYLSTMTPSAIAKHIQEADGLNMTEVSWELQKLELEKITEPYKDRDEHAESGEDKDEDDAHTLSEKEFSEFEDYYFRRNIFSCGKVRAREDSHYKESLALWEACCKTKKERE